MFCVPRPSAPTSFNGPEVPGESASSWVKFREDSGNSFTVEPSTTRPSAAFSVCNKGTLELTSIVSAVVDSFSVTSTATTSARFRVAFCVTVVNPALVTLNS